MIGKRLSKSGINNPFEKIKRAYEYSSVETAKEALSQIGTDILTNGLPDALSPFIIGITGYGNVSNGVQEMLSLLPTKEILPEELLNFSQLPNSKNIIYKVCFL